MFLKNMEKTSEEVCIAVFTGTHILVGRLTIGSQRTSDILNLEESTFLLLQNVKITSTDGKEETKVSNFAYVNKNDVAFVVPYEEETPKGNSFVTFVEKDQHEVDFVIPPYEVRGYVHLVKAMNVHDVQVMLKHRFVPLTNAMATRLSKRDVNIANPIIIVNRSKAAIFTTSNVGGLSSGCQ